MIGEIRDGETAEMALRAAQTGHLLLSTLHTTTAVESVRRLRDLGIDANTIASTLGGRDGPAPRAPRMQGVQGALSAVEETSSTSCRSARGSRSGSW